MTDNNYQPPSGEEIEQMMDSFDDLVGILAGLRARLVRQGFSENAAEHITANQHEMMCEIQVVHEERHATDD